MHTALAFWWWSVTVELSEEELTFLKEALTWSEHGYEDRSARYMHDPLVPDYYRTVYLPRKAMFSRMQAKLNKQRKVGKQ